MRRVALHGPRAHGEAALPVAGIGDLAAEIGQGVAVVGVEVEGPLGMAEEPLEVAGGEEDRGQRPLRHGVPGLELHRPAGSGRRRLELAAERVLRIAVAQLVEPEIGQIGPAMGVSGSVRTVASRQARPA